MLQKYNRIKLSNLIANLIKIKSLICNRIIIVLWYFSEYFFILPLCSLGNILLFQ